MAVGNSNEICNEHAFVNFAPHSDTSHSPPSRNLVYTFRTECIKREQYISRLQSRKTYKQEKRREYRKSTASSRKDATGFGEGGGVMKGVFVKRYQIKINLNPSQPFQSICIAVGDIAFWKTG